MLHIYAVNNCSALPMPGVVGMSGGDRIFIECSKRWTSSEFGIDMTAFITRDGLTRCQAYGLRNVQYRITQKHTFSQVGTVKWHLLNTILGSLKALRTNVEDGHVAIYSASDFWTDVLPALILKFKKRNVKWIAGFYLFPPSPFEQSVYKGFKGKLKNIAYFMSHMPAYWLVRKHADLVFVTNDLDKERFVNSQSNPSNVFVIRGGVDLKLSKLVPEQPEKKFDGVFVGRLHEQTGILELIDIWKKVCIQKNCKLAIIGVGGLENEVKARIDRQGLKDHITLFGFKDGIEKIEIFKMSKIVLHPAIYTSGGMAAAEAMACGLPGISFDLPSLRSYYPKGMVKIPLHDFKGYAEAILNLLENDGLYSKLSKEAVEWAQEWDWDERAKIALGEIHSLFDTGTSK